MPLDLPGFYWDDARKRYFPEAARPKSPAPPRPVRPLPSKRAITIRERDDAPLRPPPPSAHSTWTSSERMRGSLAGPRRRRITRGTAASQLAATAQGARYPVTDAPNDPLTAFQIYEDSAADDGAFAVLAGDNQGWLYALTGADGAAARQRELSMSSSISAITKWQNRCVATSFGPSCKLLIQESHSVETWTILGLPEKICHDVWAAHLHDHALALGAAKRGILIPDVATGRGMQVLDVGSDVLAIFQQPHLAYTGARNGSVDRFDVRAKRERAPLLEGRFARSMSSVTHLSVVREWELLVATVRGDLETHDLRFLRGEQPLVGFAGHVNSYMTKLGVAVDSAEEFLFAGGQDRRLRAWSLRTGEPALPPALPQPAPSAPPSPTSDSGADTSLEEEREGREKALPPALQPFRRTFDAPVVALNVVRGRDGREVLWAAAGGELFRYRLGQLAPC